MIVVSPPICVCSVLAVLNFLCVRDVYIPSDMIGGESRRFAIGSSRGVREDLEIVRVGEIGMGGSASCFSCSG